MYLFVEPSRKPYHFETKVDVKVEKMVNVEKIVEVEKKVEVQKKVEVK